MVRLRLINPRFLIALAVCCLIGSATSSASQELLKIDLNTSLNITYAGWEGWQLGGNSEVQETTFSNGIHFAFTNPTDVSILVGPRGNTNWGAFAGDTVELIDPPVGTGDLACTISYLSPGNYTLITYHNEWIDGSNMDVYQQIDDEPNVLVYHDIEQCHNVPNNEYVIANGAVSLTFDITVPGQTFTSKYITSYRYNPGDPNNSDANSYNVAICGFKLIANAVYSAYSPSPVPEARIRYNTTYDLCWNTPDPIAAGTQRYDLYFTSDPNELTDPGTGDPLFPTGPAKLVSYQLQSGRMCVTCPTLSPYTDYYWRVDSYEEGVAEKIVGAVWHFDTMNQPPTLDLGPNQVTKQGREVTLTAQTTDLDGLPLVGYNLTYEWTWRNDPNADPNNPGDPNYGDAFGSHDSPFPATTQSVSFILDPNDAHTGSGRAYTFRCTVSDGENSSYKDIVVACYNDSMTNCEINKKLSNYQTAIRAPGDFNDDCITDMRDLSLYVAQWLACKAIDNVCP